MAHTRSRLARVIFDNSLLLLAGTIAAVVWANLDLASYDRFTHPLHFWVNDVGMVFFFALAAKEVFEATLPGGPLASPRQARCAAGRGRRRHGGAGVALSWRSPWTSVPRSSAAAGPFRAPPTSPSRR